MGNKDRIFYRVQYEQQSKIRNLYVMSWCKGHIERPKKIVGQQNFGSEKRFWSEKIWGQILGPSNVLGLDVTKCLILISLGKDIGGAVACRWCWNSWDMANRK